MLNYLDEINLRIRSPFSDTSAEIAENITYLGARGLLNLACGLSVAFLSGRYGAKQSDYSFSEETAAQLLVPATAGSGFKGIIF